MLNSRRAGLTNRHVDLMYNPDTGKLTVDICRMTVQGDKQWELRHGHRWTTRQVTPIDSPSAKRLEQVLSNHGRWDQNGVIIYSLEAHYARR